jgi:hypothetical protein
MLTKIRYKTTTIKLEWWEERNKKQLMSVRYVKGICGNTKGHIFEIQEITNSLGKKNDMFISTYPTDSFHGGVYEFFLNEFLPASEKEYLSYYNNRFLN